MPAMQACIRPITYAHGRMATRQAAVLCVKAVLLCRIMRIWSRRLPAIGNLCSPISRLVVWPPVVLKTRGFCGMPGCWRGY